MNVLIPDFESLKKAIEKWQAKKLGIKDLESLLNVPSEKQKKIYDDWKGKHDPSDAIDEIAKGMVSGMQIEMAKGRPPSVALNSALISMFIMGWEMREKFDPPKKKGDKEMILPTGEYVIVNHWRRSRNRPKIMFVLHGMNHEAHARGGFTEVLVFDRKDGNVLARGESRCNPLDTYNKKLGREIALGRALKQLRVAQETQLLLDHVQKKTKEKKSGKTSSSTKTEDR